MDNDIDVTQALTRGVSNNCTSFFGWSGQLLRTTLPEAFRTRPRRRQHLCTEFAKQVDRRSAGAFRCSGDERAFTSKIEKIDHHLISSLAILSFLVVKAKVSVTGLPGN